MTQIAEKGAEKHVLVVEDQGLLAAFLSDLLCAGGYGVYGPFACVDEASAALEKATPFAAILDVSLGGDATSEPVAHALKARQCPFAFATGFEIDEHPVVRKFPDARRFEKPFNNRALLGWLESLA